MSDVTRWAKVHKAKRAEKKAKKLGRRSTYAKPAPDAHDFLGGLDLSDDLVTVSLPFWKTPPKLIERALQSVLTGKHQHLRVVVIADGSDAIPYSGKGLDDPRVVLVRSPRNMGPYFNHDVVLRAATGPWFAVQDSDDVSLPNRFVDQLHALHHQRGQCVHSPIKQVVDGKTSVLRVSTKAVEPFTHPSDHFGLYSRNALLALGGYHAGYRVGYDTMVTSLLNLLAVTRATKRPVYVRHSRSGSLTRAPSTGHGSDLRQRHQRSLRVMWATAFAKASVSKREGQRWVREQAIARSRKYGDLGLRKDLVAQVRELLGAVDARVPRVHPALLARVIEGTTQTAYSISKRLAKEIYAHCVATRPKVVLDIGSGLSTSVLALYAARYGATVISLEHDRKWHNATEAGLRRMGLASHVELVHAPLRSTELGPWYTARLGRLLGGRKIDFAFVDGPPESCGGRKAAMSELRAHLSSPSRLWVHDALRPGERDAIRSWRSQVGAVTAAVDTAADERGVAKLEVTP